MERTEHAIEILNDLVQINNDRIVGYEKAIKELKSEDLDLKALFESLVIQSQKIKMELSTEIGANRGSTSEDTTTSGKLYRAWMDVKAVFTGHDRHAVLSNCEAGEDAAQKAYRDALQEEDLSADLRSTIMDQQTRLKESHDKIKALRDAQA